MKLYQKLIPVKKVKSPIKKLFGLSLSSQIIIGLVLGIIAGLFFGERCKIMLIPADIFITFLQIPVIPYVLFSLIHGIGSLNKKIALKLAGMGGLILLLFWCLSLFYVLASQIAFPDWNSKMFFSIVKSTSDNLNYYTLFIPSNPFYSLANEMVPAIVVFALLVGSVLIGIKYERKKCLLDICELIVNIMSKLTHIIVRFTPLGVFAMAANAAGTLTLEELGQIQVYICVFIVSALLLSFLALPLLVSILTPFRYRDFLRVSKDAMMTAFTTGNLLVILPLVASGIKELMESYGCYDKENEDLQRTILPVYFNFPDSGKMLVLIFILFASWYTGGEMSFENYPLFLSSGVFGMFASANVTIPFLLSLFGIQPAMFQIYLMAGIFNGNFSSLTAAVDIFAFTILCICSMRGLLKLQWKKLGLVLCIVIAVSISSFLGIRVILNEFFKPGDYTKEKLMSMNISNPIDETQIFQKLPPIDKTFIWDHVNLLNNITKRRILRVGYLPNRLPFVYRNNYLPEKDRSILQGIEAEMMNDLAWNLKAKLEYYPVTEKQAQSALNNNQVDIVIGGIGMTVNTLKCYGFTDHVLELHPAIIAKYKNISEFKNVKKIKKRTDLVLAYSSQIISQRSLQGVFPKAKLMPIANPEDFYKGKIKADALVISAEQGAAFAIMYPKFSYITKPIFTYGITLTGFAVNKNQLVLIEFLNRWIVSNRASGAIKKYYDYWILGKSDSKSKKKRWCILDDVLE